MFPYLLGNKWFFRLFRKAKQKITPRQYTREYIQIKTHVFRGLLSLLKIYLYVEKFKVNVMCVVRINYRYTTIRMIFWCVGVNGKNRKQERSESLIMNETTYIRVSQCLIHIKRQIHDINTTEQKFWFSHHQSNNHNNGMCSSHHRRIQSHNCGNVGFWIDLMWIRDWFALIWNSVYRYRFCNSKVK